MAKLSDYEFRNLGQQAVDFHDDVRDLLNNGRIQFQMLVATTGPKFTVRAGEVSFVHNGTAIALYVYAGSSWNLMLTTTGLDGSADSVIP